MYESPIKLVEKQMRFEMEDEVYRAIREVDIEVDKDELIKALQYDREQYSKGYADGVKELAERLYSYLDVGHLRPPTEKAFSEIDVQIMIKRIEQDMTEVKE